MGGCINIDGVNNSNISDGDAVSTWTDLSGNGNHGSSIGLRCTTCL